MARGRSRLGLVAAALALALLAFAGVRSPVMRAQAAALAGTPMCGADAGGRHGGHHDATHRGCDVCALAALAPLPTLPPRLPLPEATVHAAARPAGPSSARGPPAAEPRARDPPSRLLTA